MANLTEQERLVRRLPEPAPHPDHYLLVFKRSGRDWKLRLSLGPGEPYRKPFLESPDALVAYIIPSEPHLRYSFDDTYKTHDQLHSFKLQLTLEYRISDPASLIQKFERDPLQSVIDEIDSYLKQRIKSLDWTAVEHEQVGLEQILFHHASDEGSTGFAKLRHFADQQGIGIQRILVVRELPKEETKVAAAEVRNIRDQHIAVIEHGTRSLRQNLGHELADRQKTFDRRNQLAQNITNNIGRAFDQATDNIRSLDDIQRAVPKVAAIQGAITGVATGALPGVQAAGVLSGGSGMPLLSSASAESPLTALLVEVAGALGGLDCDPADRRAILSWSLHLIAEALRGSAASQEELETYVNAVTGKFTDLLRVLNPAQVKLIKRLQDVEALKKELSR